MTATTDNATAWDDTDLQVLARDLGERLKPRRLRLATAESCTGGWLGKVITDVAGSSDWYEGGFVTYSNALKNSVLKVPEALLEKSGAVSEAVVAAMAVGACEAAACRASIAVSGVAGPAGGSADKPVGLVWFGFCLEAQRWTASRQFDGNREQVRRAAVAFGLKRLMHQMDC